MCSIVDLRAVLSKKPSGRLEPIHDGTFKHFVAELDPNPAQDVGIDDLLDRNIAADLLG
jgi:hypothetical protein